MVDSLCVRVFYEVKRSMHWGLRFTQTSFVFSQIGPTSIYHFCLSGALNVKNTWVCICFSQAFHILSTSQTPSWLSSVATGEKHNKKSRVFQLCLQLTAVPSKAPGIPPNLIFLTYPPYMVFITTTSHCSMDLTGLTFTLIEVSTSLTLNFFSQVIGATKSGFKLKYLNY